MSAPSPAAASSRRVNVALGSAPEAGELVAIGISVVIHEQRFLDNSRRISAICEVALDGTEAVVHDLFSFTPEGVDDRNVVTGNFAAHGRVPRFIEDMGARGEIEADLSIFES